MVSWLKPPLESVYLKVDGKFIRGLAGLRWLVGDSGGKFICGFHGVVYVIHADIMFLLQGPCNCWDMGVTKLVCYFDSSYARQLIWEGSQDYHKYGREITLIRDHINKVWDIQLHNILIREDNQYEGFLAKLGSYRPRSDLYICKALSLFLFFLFCYCNKNIWSVRASHVP